MRKALTLIVFATVCELCPAQSDQTGLQLKTASSHPIEYYLSLPQDWTPTKKWPVVVVIESANKEFEATAQIFVRARQRMPFILVAPLVVTNGGPNYRQAATYHYSEAVWTEIERIGRCKFDQEGIAAVVKDVHKLYAGEEKYFLTGWEAAGHTIWATVFQHPDILRAVAPVCPNYQARCLDPGSFSSAPERVKLPIRGFYGAGDTLCTPGRPIHSHWTEAAKTAEARGFTNVTLQAVPAQDHTPLAAEVLAYFFSLAHL